MNEEKIEEIKNSIKQLMEFISTQTEEPPQEILDLLEQVMTYAANRIAELRQQAPPIPEQNPELTPSMPSSNIDAFGYDEKTGKLMVKFLGKHPNRNGSVYAYQGVPKVIFDLFRQGAIPARTTGKNKWGSWWKGKVPSAGASLYTLIKGGGYQYQRLS